VGRRRARRLDEARERLPPAWAPAGRGPFTSGGTEADNLAVLGAWRARRTTGGRRS
jgi:cysteine desulfurase